MADDLDTNVRNLSCPEPRYRWLPVDALLPGMTLARRVVGQEEGRTRLMLAVGTILTAGTIDQLTIKAVECVAVLNEHPPEADIYLALHKAYEARLRVIFGCPEEQEEGCRALFDALLAAAEPPL